MFAHILDGSHLGLISEKKLCKVVFLARELCDLETKLYFEG